MKKHLHTKFINFLIERYTKEDENEKGEIKKDQEEETNNDELSNCEDEIEELIKEYKKLFEKQHGNKFCK